MSQKAMISRETQPVSFYEGIDKISYYTEEDPDVVEAFVRYCKSEDCVKLASIWLGRNGYRSLK